MIKQENEEGKNTNGPDGQGERAAKEKIICLAGSSGGHLTHLLRLREFWKGYEHFWVTFDKEDARSRLEGETVYFCSYPSNRSLKALFKNSILALRLLRKKRPDMIISSGAACSVPFFYVGKLIGAKLVYIEVFDRFDKLSLAGRLVYPISDLFFVQWEEMAEKYKKASYIGKLF